MRYWRNWIGLQVKPSRQLVLNGFSRRIPKQWIHRWQQRCQICLRECPGELYSTQTAYAAENDVEGLPYAEKNPLQLPMDSREGSFVSLSPMTRIFKSVLNICSHNLWKTAHSRACQSGQHQVLKLQSFWSVLDPIRGQCRFLSLILKFARSRKSLISANCRYSGAWIELTFAFDFQSPRTERTCHSVGTTRSREVGTNSGGCRKSPKLWKIHLGCLPCRRVHWQWYFFWRYCTFFKHQIFRDSGPEKRKCFPLRIWYSAIDKHKRSCCHMTFFYLEFLVESVGDITTILGFVLDLWPKALQYLGWEAFRILCS